MLAASASALWVWLGGTTEPELAAMRAAMEHAPEGVRAAVGATARGITGFRRSHEAAVAAQCVVATYGGPARMTSYTEIQVAALAGQDRERAAAFVASTLGPLAARDAAVACLRETLRIYLEEGGNAPRAAERLATHRNTILHRVARAEGLLGRPIGEQRLALAVALELAHWGCVVGDRERGGVNRSGFLGRPVL